MRRYFLLWISRQMNHSHLRLFWKMSMAIWWNNSSDRRCVRKRIYSENEKRFEWIQMENEMKMTAFSVWLRFSAYPQYKFQQSQIRRKKEMKKNNVQKIRRIKVVTKIEKKQDRPMFPRPVIFSDKKTYDRNREKRRMRMRDEYGCWMDREYYGSFFLLKKRIMNICSIRWSVLNIIEQI